MNELQLDYCELEFGNPVVNKKDRRRVSSFLSSELSTFNELVKHKEMFLNELVKHVAAARCYTLLHVATRCYTLLHVATRCYTLLHV